MIGETENKPYDEEKYAALVAKLQREIKRFQKKNEPLQNEIKVKLLILEEIITSVGNPEFHLTEGAAKYLHDKYMLDTYNESKTRPIKSVNTARHSDQVK